nr:hypothetical protein Iba_contig173CG0020 [Ipomoea batatas]
MLCLAEEEEQGFAPSPLLLTARPHVADRTREVRRCRASHTRHHRYLHPLPNTAAEVEGCYQDEGEDVREEVAGALFAYRMEEREPFTPTVAATADRTENVGGQVHAVVVLRYHRTHCSSPRRGPALPILGVVRVRGGEHHSKLRCRKWGREDVAVPSLHLGYRRMERWEEMEAT